MNLPWISITPNLLEGISLMNSLSNECFKHILSQSVRTENLIDDIEQFKHSSNLKPNELTHVMQTIRYIMKQASKIIMKPTNFQCNLTETMKLQGEKAEEMAKLWAEETIKSFKLDNPKKIEQISWDLALCVASSVCPSEVIPHAKIQFRLASQDENDTESLHLDLDEDGLLSLYKNIENIQITLDSIQGS